MLNISTQRFEAGVSNFEITGTRLEQEFLGEIKKDQYKEMAYLFLHKELTKKADNPDDEYLRILNIREKAREEFQTALDLSKRGKYIDFANSLKLAESCQVGNPENPTPFFAAALHKNVKDLFVDKYILKFFTAAGGSHLDVCHGIDAFFKLYNKENGEELAMASLDLTMNPNKTEAVKADILADIKIEDYSKYDPSKGNEKFDKNFFNDKIKDLSEIIAYALVEDYKKKNK
jgi:hypothetical protein